MDVDAVRAAGDVHAGGRIANGAVPGQPAAGATTGEYQDRRVTASIGGNAFDRGYQAIEYPHIRRQHIYQSADTIVESSMCGSTPNLTVGYIVGVGDEVPAAIAQLGARVEMIGPDELAWGNLSRFNTIVTGVRAYERRGDLRANNSRLLDYVKRWRHADRPVQQVRVQSGAVRTVPGQGDIGAGHRRERPGHDRAIRTIRC